MDTLYFQEFSKNRELEKKLLIRLSPYLNPPSQGGELLAILKKSVLTRTLFIRAEYTCRSTSTRKQSHVPMKDVSFLDTDYTDFTDIFDGECNTLFLLTPSTAISEGDSSKCNTM